LPFADKDNDEAADTARLDERLVARNDLRE
jgi:hypothetical protein